MSTKASRQTLSGCNLARYYKQAHSEMLGIVPHLSERHMSMFLTLEDDLRDLAISSRDYAYTVTRLLRGWLHDKRLRFIPVHVFCGKWAFGKFMKVYHSDQVQVTYDDTPDILLYSEILVAKEFIKRNLESDVPIRLLTVVEDLRPLLDKNWLECYHNGNGRPVDDAIYEICAEYGVKAENYNDIIAGLRSRQTWQSTNSTVVSV